MLYLNFRYWIQSNAYYYSALGKMFTVLLFGTPLWQWLCKCLTKTCCLTFLSNIHLKITLELINSQHILHHSLCKKNILQLVIWPNVISGPFLQLMCTIDTSMYVVVKTTVLIQYTRGKGSRLYYINWMAGGKK